MHTTLSQWLSTLDLYHCDSCLNRMTALQTIQFEGRDKHVGDELRPDIILGIREVDTHVLDKGSVAFFQPQIGPPNLFKRKRSIE